MQAQEDLGIMGRSNWLNGWSTFSPDTKDYSTTTKILIGNISTNMRLVNTETYNLVGEVFVTNNAILTIEPGTIIRASSGEYSSLIITKGSKIIADGSGVSPIVFTSDKAVNERKSGDWGGIYILGSAPMNTYGNMAKINSKIPGNFRVAGGDIQTDNSGILRNVRVEFAGRGESRYSASDAITFVGVGSGTIIEAVQVSLASANSFKFIGGNAKASKLVSYRCKSSDFEFTQGVFASLDNCLVLRNPYYSASTNFRGVTVNLSENADLTDLSKPVTDVNLTNFTILNESDGKAGTQGLIKEAIYVNNDCKFSIKNSVISGFDSALLLNANVKINNTSLSAIKLQKVFINNCPKNIVSEVGGVVNDDLEVYYSSKVYANRYSKTKADELFVDAGNTKTPDFRVKIDNIKYN